MLGRIFMSIKSPVAQRSRGSIVAVLAAAALNAVLIILLIHLQTYTSTAGTTQIPSVSVADQQEVPLAILVEGYDVSEPSSLRLRYRVQNISNKAIQAYAILEEIGGGRGGTTGATVVNLGKGTKFLQPTQTRLETCDLPSQNGPATSLTLSVDYVEFDDGTTWGKDTRRSADYLAGQREGKRATLKKFREVREKSGDPAIEELLNRKDAEVVVPPAGHSAEWEYGFRVGHNTALRQLRGVHSKGGVPELISELQRESDEAGREKQ
jgi:hypothetical protein